MTWLFFTMSQPLHYKSTFLYYESTFLQFESTFLQCESTFLYFASSSIIMSQLLFFMNQIFAVHESTFGFQWVNFGSQCNESAFGSQWFNFWFSMSQLFLYYGTTFFHCDSIFLHFESTWDISISSHLVDRVRAAAWFGVETDLLGRNEHKNAQFFLNISTQFSLNVLPIIQ